jgi:DNA-binding helix-hairpin-helix protein with protein kinase domain
MPQTTKFAPGHSVVTARTRQRLTLAKRIGGGGEGDVFTVMERPGTLAKIYHKTVDGVLDAKLAHLTSRNVPTLKAVSAWPEERILHPRGGTVGFLMPAVTDAKPLHELMTPKVRRKEFPSASFNQLVEVALAVSKAIEAFHGEDLVVGDINGRNILVRTSGSVCLIDIDSIQVGNGRQFPCTVGFPEYTPPELQGLKLADNRRSKDSDRFSLSVVVFQLLAMGRHPFDGTRLPRETAIKRHVSAFAWAPFLRTRPLAPIGLRTDDLFDKRITELFGHAFAVSARFTGRPTAREWADALADYQTHLNACAANPAHQYPMTLRHCPWCELERKGKPPAFAATTVPYTHWTQHYEGMMRLLLGRFAPIVLPSAYRAFFRVLPRRVWMGLGAAGLVLSLRACGPSLLPPSATSESIIATPTAIVPPIKPSVPEPMKISPLPDERWEKMTFREIRATVEKERREKAATERKSRRKLEPSQDLPQQN